MDDTRPDTGEAAEKALAHEDENAVRAAYCGSDVLEQRRPLMEAWGLFYKGGRVARTGAWEARLKGVTNKTE